MDLLGGISFDSKTLDSSSMLGCYFVSFDVSIICDSSDRTVYEVRFSDIPILLAFFILGPLGGLQVAFLRSLLYFMISGPSLPQLIGVSLSFVATLAVCYHFTICLKTSH